MTIKRYDGNCFWKDGLENAPTLSLFETIKNEMTDWDVKVDYVSFDEIQVASSDAPAQFILINNERGYVLNGEVTLANEVRVFRYNLDYISTFFLPFLSNLQTQPLYMYALRAPFFDAKSAIQNDDEKIRAINQVGTYKYGKNYYYKENTTNSGQNVVRCYDDYTKSDALNYIEYNSNDNIVNGCLYFVFADGNNGRYRYIPVLAKEGSVIYGKNASSSSTEPSHTYQVTINGTNPLLIMPNYQDFISANYVYSDGNCASYSVTKTFNFRDVRCVNGTNPTSKFPSTLSSTQLSTLLDEYAGSAYLTFPDYGGESSANEKYNRVLYDGVTSTQKFYLDGNTVSNSSISIFWSMVKNSGSDNHYYNQFEGLSKSTYNRLLVDVNFNYLSYADVATSNSNGTFKFTKSNPTNNIAYYLKAVPNTTQYTPVITNAFSFNTQSNLYDLLNNYSFYLYNASQANKLLYNNQTSSNVNISTSTNICSHFILTTPYKFSVSLKEYNYSSNNTHYQQFKAFQGVGYYPYSGAGLYTPYFSLAPTYYFINNANSYNTTSANYNPTQVSYIAPTIWAQKRGTPGNANQGVDRKIISQYSENSAFYFGIQFYKKPQSQNTTSIKITFPSKTTTIQNRYNIHNSWSNLYSYATSYYSNGSGNAAQFLGIFMLPHMFAFPNSVKQIQTRGSYQFLELDIPSDGVDIKPFKFLNGANFNYSNATPSKILHPNDTNIKQTWWYFVKYSDVLYMNNEIHPEYYFFQYNQMMTDGWFCFNGTGTYIDKLDILSLKACTWTLPGQLPSFTNTYASYVQSTINSANTSYKVAKNNMIGGVVGGLMNIAASAATGAFSMGMGNVLAGALGDIGGVAGGIGRTVENVSAMTGFVTNNKIKLSQMMGASQLTSGALKNSGGLISSIIGFKNRQMEIKANYADAKNKLQNKLNPSTSEDISLLEEWVGETSQYNVVEYFFPDLVTSNQWNSVLYYYSFKLNKNEYSNVLFNENNWSMFNDCVYFTFDDELMKSKIQSYQPFNDMYSEVKKYIYELLTNGFRLWRRKPEECEL